MVRGSALSAHLWFSLRVPPVLALEASPQRVAVYVVLWRDNTLTIWRLLEAHGAGECGRTGTTRRTCYDSMWAACLFLAGCGTSGAGHDSPSAWMIHLPHLEKAQAAKIAVHPPTSLAGRIVV